MRKALIASGVNINKDEYVHVLAKTASGLETAILDKYDNLWYIPEDNYKINEGRLRTVFTENNLTKATYILEGEFDVNNHIVEGSFFQCFHVKSYRVQSGMIIYDLERDEWANEIGHATINDMVVTKCNRAISDGGSYPDPVAVKPCEETYGIELGEGFNDIATQEKWDIVFTADVTVWASVDGKTKYIQKFLFHVHPIDVLKALGGGKWPAGNLADGTPLFPHISSDLLLAIRALFTITSTPTSDQVANFFGVNLPVTVKDVYLVPYHGYADWYQTFGLMDPYGNSKRGSGYVNAYFEGMNGLSLELDLSKIPSEKLIQDKIFIGTRNNVFPLPRTIKQPNYKIDFKLSDEGVTVTGKFGSEFVDFTDDFKVTMLGDANEISATERLANAIFQIGDLAKNSVRVMNVGSPFWQGLGISGLVQNVSRPLMSSPDKPSLNSNGDAISTFNLISGIYGGYYVSYIPFPLRYFAFESYENEQARAWKEGADFNVNVSAKETPEAGNQYIGMDYVTSCPHLGTTYYGAPEEDETYIRASVKVRGANSVASDFITSEFARGIYVKIYE